MTIDFVNVSPSSLDFHISNLFCPQFSLPNQKLYKEDNIPKYHAKIPELTLQIRAASVSRSVHLFYTPSLLDFCVLLFQYCLSLPCFLQSIVFKEIAFHAQEDIELIKQEIIDLQPLRITTETTYKDMCKRYPQYARQIEAEIGMGMYHYGNDPETFSA